MTKRSLQAGFSLIEMVVVLGIAAIFMAIATFSFRSFNVKTNIESQVKQMTIDLNQMRMRAITTKKVQGVKLAEFSYTFYDYSSVYDMNPIQPLPGGAHTVRISQLSALPSTKFANSVFQIDPQGMLLGSNAQTIFLSGGYNVGSVNCVLLTATRALTGKQNALGGCDAQ
jgi:type II secretion system protein H